MKQILLLLVPLCLNINFTLLKAQSPDTITVMVYNLLNFPDGRNDCASNIVVPERWDTLAKIMDFMAPDVLMVCELQHEIGADEILNNALNVNGRSGYQRANFVVNQSTFLSDLNNILFYNSNKVGLIQQGEILTDLRDVSVYHLFGKDPNLATTNDTTFMDFMVTHLKASSGAANETRRAEECDSIRKYIDTASTARNVILGGDFNFYASTEPGFQILLGGIHPLFDPINVTGAWDNNFAYAPYHTQSTRMTTPRLDCGALGGMDSRFDFLLMSDPIRLGSKRVRYIPTTYMPLGNNGSTYNDPINDVGNTSTVPPNVLEALYSMSDHLPVVMQLEITYPSPTLLSNDLIRFEGKNVENGHLINWAFNQPNDVDFQLLEFSENGIGFNDLGTWTNETIDFFHPTHSNQDYYYRLKWEVASQVFYSKTIYLNQNNPTPIATVFPNPTSADFYIQIKDDLSFENTSIAYYNAVGQCVYNTEHNFSENAKVQVSKNNLSPGMYILKIKNTNYTIQKRVLVR